MEGELWSAMYRLLWQEAKRRNRTRGVIYSDGLILMVYLWSVLHDPTLLGLSHRELASGDALAHAAV